MNRSPRLPLLTVTAAAVLALGLGCYDSFALQADADDDLLPPRDDALGELTADAVDAGPDVRDDARADTPADRSDGSPDAAETESDAHADSEADRSDVTDRPDSPDAESDVPTDSTDVGPCVPVPETCNGRDDDCDGLVDNGGACPCATHHHAGHTYLFCEPRTWDEARRFCLGLGYDLASINDAGENEWMDATTDVYSTEKAWVGFTDQAAEGLWIWINGDPVTYTNWEVGEPNDFAEEDCGQLNRFHPATTWNDEPCTGSLQFVCESLATPVPFCGDGRCDEDESCGSCPGDCGSCPDGGADAGTDTVPPDAADAEADLFDEVPAESDGATETCPGGWFDPSSGLCWQNPPAPEPMTWSRAASYCATSQFPAGSWHLPTIDELRSLVRSCSRTETGGACGVTDSCLEHDCWALTSCNECLAGGGPAAGGAYWPDELTGTVAWYWSASSYVENPSWAWFVSYDGANISWDDKTSPGYVRCVRPGP